MKNLADKVIRYIQGVNRALSPEQVLITLNSDWLSFIKPEVVKTMPRGYGDDWEITFIRPNCILTSDDLDRFLAKEGLVIADPYTIIKFNRDNPSFVDKYPNAVYWKNEAGKWCYINFSFWGTRRKFHSVYVDCGCVRWDCVWYFATFRKESLLNS